MKHMLLVIAVVSGVALAAPARQHPPWATVGRPASVSPRPTGDPGTPSPGGAADAARLIGLEKTAGGKRDGRLFLAFSDAAGEGHATWDVVQGVQPARDVFARWSDDEGVTWSEPVNLSRSAGLYSALTDWDGDGSVDPCWGDNGKSTVFAQGDVVVVAWTSRYVPDEDWVWGQVGDSSLQGRRTYADPAVRANEREVPHSAVFLAVSADGGETWIHGGDRPPLQITHGSRDAIQLSHRGQGRKWGVVWQEDEAGLTPGEAEGPGEGASGATVSPGTDVWYAWTDDIVARPAKLAATRTPLSDNSEYGATAPDLARITTGGEGGHGASGTDESGGGHDGGSGENGGDETSHGASRPNLMFATDGGVTRALVVYEETKGVQDVLAGKTVNYHSFAYDAPPRTGDAASVRGAPGTVLTPLAENSRRARLVTQAADGVSPAVAVFWRQGVADEGGPADIMLKVSKSFDPAAVAAAPSLNLSSGSPAASPANLTDATSANPYEDAKAHRAILRDDVLVVGYSYSPNGVLARYTDQANYDFWIRRSLDGGATWLAPQNVSQLPATTVSVAEPRLVAPPNTGAQDDASFVALWTVETNPYDGFEAPVALDIQMTRTADHGATFTAPIAVSGEPGDQVYESQVRVDEDVNDVYAVWLRGKGPTEVEYSHTSILPPVAVFTPGDRLVGRLDDPSDVTRAAFFGVNGARVRFEFAGPRMDLRLRVEVIPETGPPRAAWIIEPGIDPELRSVLLRDSGLHSVRITALDGSSGAVDIRTSASLPRSARTRALTVRARRGTDAEVVHVAALPGAELSVRLVRPGRPHTRLDLAVIGPGGAALDTARHEVEVVGGGRQITSLPLDDGGIYVVQVSGFWRGRDAARLWIEVAQPDTDGARVELP